MKQKFKKCVVALIISMIILTVTTSVFAVTTSKRTTSKKLTTKKIEKDVFSAEKEDITYENQIINGNVVVASAKKITLTNAKVNGDIIAFADEIEIINSNIEGNVCLASNKLIVSDSEIVSMYAVCKEMELDDGVEIARELRCVGEDVIIDAIISRDVTVVAKKIEIGDNAELVGEAKVYAESKVISEDAYINDLKFEKTDFSNYEDFSEINFSPDFKTLLVSSGTKIFIIMIIALLILACLPKFTEVNSCLRLRDFVKSFFAGILEFLIVIFIAILFICMIYGAGYGLILLNLLVLFLVLGKTIFIISVAVRVTCNPEKISKPSAFLATVLVGWIMAGIDMITLVGPVGIIIVGVIDVILSFTGLGTMFQILFVSKKKLNKLAQKKSKVKTVVQEAVPVEVVSEPVKVEEKVETANQEELQAEIKAEVKEEIKELKEEREEEKKLEEKPLETNTEEPKKENKDESQNSNEEKKDEEKKD